MLFNSFEYILFFLPLTVAGYFLLTRLESATPAKAWLLLCSLFFYSWWNLRYLPLILVSIGVNYGVARLMAARQERRGALLAVGLVFNLGLLAHYKYTNFFLGNGAALLGLDYTFERLALPLAISFFTLQQIAFLVDCREKLATPGNLLDYATFVSFFPQLIAGPIVHHRQLIPQFAATDNKRPDWDNIAKGVSYFAVGLFKKVVVADTFARFADAGYAAASSLSAVESVSAVLAYTFQLYFDFGGYMDMAIGAALLVNIDLPINFDSPFKAASIIDFWRRWHITLSNFITTYLYTPIVRLMGRFSRAKSLAAIGIAMFIAGLWHGAAWTFIAFGCIHGAALIVNHLWRGARRKMPHPAGVALTFGVTALSLCFFRATSMGQAFTLLADLTGRNGWLPRLGSENGLGLLLSLKETPLFAGMGTFDVLTSAAVTVSAAVMAFAARNTHQMFQSFTPTRRRLLLCALCLAVSFLYMNSFSEKEFLYFDF